MQWWDRQWWEMNQSLPEVGCLLLLFNEQWLCFSLLRQKKKNWPHQHLDENLILETSSHIYLEESNRVKLCVILGRKKELSCTETFMRISETQLWACQVFWKQRRMYPELRSSWNRVYVELSFIVSCHSSSQVLVWLSKPFIWYCSCFHLHKNKWTFELRWDTVESLIFSDVCLIFETSAKKKAKMRIWSVYIRNTFYMYIWTYQELKGTKVTFDVL